MKNITWEEKEKIDNFVKEWLEKNPFDEENEEEFARMNKKFGKDVNAFLIENL